MTLIAHAIRRGHRRALLGLVLATGLALIPAALALAQTADGETPASEDVCRDLEGAQYGQCNAYCEAMDCHLGDGVRASKNACDKALERYRTKFHSDPPCITGNCAASCQQEAMEAFYACGGTSACIKLAQSTFSSCFGVTCPKQCYVQCAAGCNDKACDTACRDQCGPGSRCTLSCETKHFSALLACEVHDATTCGKDEACKESTTYNRTACEAAADAAHDACLTTCGETPGGACTADAVENCGARENSCFVDGRCQLSCSATWDRKAGCVLAPKCDFCKVPVEQPAPPAQPAAP